MELTKYLNEETMPHWHRLVDGATNVVLLGHSGPDGDAMGSVLAMLQYLESEGKEVTAITPNPCPDFLRWLPDIQRVVFARNNPNKAEEAIQNADLIICLDFNGWGRLDELGDLVESLSAPKIMIDHHIAPADGVDLLISNPGASATCEIVFCLLHQLGAYERMSKDIAQCLYCGIMTDTGAFAYNSNRPELFVITALLINCGIDKDEIYRNVYYSYSESRLRLMGHLMCNKMIYMAHEHTSLYWLTLDEMKHFAFVRGDAEGFVNLPLQIKGTKLSIALREDTEQPVVRVSLRSVGDFPCNEMAERFFNGGGHKNAAGGSLPKPIETAVETAKKAIAAYRDRLV